MVLWGKRIWAYTLYLLMMVIYTAVNVPYGSLLGVMTDNDDEKNQFSSFRMVGAYAMGFVTLLSFPYLQKLVGGSDQHQYAVLGAFFGIIAAAGTLACGLLTKERLKPVRAEKFSFKPFGDLFRNRPWIILTLVGVCTNFFNGFRYAVAGYMFEYCMHGDVTVSGLIINYTVFMTFGELTCMVFGGVSPVFTRWVGSKRRAFMWAAVICAVTSIGFFFVPMDPAYIWVMVAVVILTSIGIGIYSPLLWSMYADVSDYATEKNGTSSTGLIFSSGTMAMKFGTAISGSLVALLLGFAGFISGTDATGQTVITITDQDAVNAGYAGSNNAVADGIKLFATGFLKTVGRCFAIDGIDHNLLGINLFDDIKPRGDILFAGIVDALALILATHEHGLNDDVAIEGLHAVDDGLNVVVAVGTVYLIDVLRIDGIEFQDIVVNQHECVVDRLAMNHG